MKKFIALLTAFASVCWSVPKPMESIKNYNVLMVHGAYGWNKGFIWPHMSEDYWEDSYGYEDFKSEIRTRLDDVIDALDTALPSAYDDTTFLGKATLGSYTSDSRITRWLNEKIFEEKIYSKEYENVRNSYIYNWRSFSNPANSSSNNAHELGDRAWNKGNLNYGKGGFGRRRALMEESQEVKASWYDAEKDSLYVGQDALEIIRQNPDLYRQLASRYILIGHSMGGVVSREYVQSDYYNDDVDKIITLDSPHEGTGALNMQVAKEVRGGLGENAKNTFVQAALFSGILGSALTLVASDDFSVKTALITLAASFAIGEATPYLARAFSPEIYHKDDSLVSYVDPKKTGKNTVYELNHKDYDTDKQPMYRILASKNAMTFTDPTPDENSLAENIYRALVPDVISLPFENAISQLTGNSEGTICYVNTMASFIAGVGGFSVKDNGSSIVPDTSSEARHVDLLNNSAVDIKRAYFNAAPNSIESDADKIALMSIASDAILALEIIAKLGGFGAAAATAGKLAIAIPAAYSISLMFIPAAVAGFSDLKREFSSPMQLT